jgi:hypothetical protein
MATLQNAIDELPLHFSSRYEDAFWIKKANRILGEIETKTDQSTEILEVPVFLIENVTQYNIPDALREVIRARGVTPGNVNTIRIGDPGTQPPYRIIGDKIRFENLPSISGNEDVSGTVAAIESNHSIVSGMLSTGTDDAGNALDDGGLQSRLFTLTHTADGSIEYRIISYSTTTSDSDTSGDITTATDQSNFKSTGITGATDDFYNNFNVTVTFAATGNSETRTVSNYVSVDGTITVGTAFTETITTNDSFIIVAGTALPNGTFDTAPVIGDTFVITSNFYMIEGWKLKTQFTAVGDTLPVDNQFVKIFIDGLRFFGELQTDLDPKRVPYWESLYEKGKKDYVSYYRRPKGDQRQIIVDDGWNQL